MDRRQKITRIEDDDVLYGVFANGDGDDFGYEGSGSNKRRKDLSKRTDFTKPISFVSAGSVMPNQEIDRNTNKPKEPVSTFEKHTKGIGMKLLVKMGYKGGSLGKNKQGILAPIEVKPRPKNMGMGFNDYRESNRPALQEVGEEVVPCPSQTLEVPSEEKHWSKQFVKKKKQTYITAEELLAQKQERGFEVVQKVLDMRGPQVRVLTNLKNLNVEEKGRENDVPMPELRHNVRLIVELDILKLDRDLRNGRETVVALQEEKENLQKETNKLQQRKNLEEIVNVLDQIAEKSTSGTLTLEYLAKSFMDLQTRYAGEYTSCNLSWIACSYALPLFIRLFKGWDPLQNPTLGVEVVSLWKKLLPGKDSNFSAKGSPYMQLLMEVVLPVVDKISVTNSWQVRDPEPMLRFLKSWEDLLPSPVLQTILDNVIMPKILVALDSWDARTETVSIHSWIHPWLPLLGHKLESCYGTIRNKLARVLHAWHPSDMSAYNILSPWKTVFDPSSWEQLMVRCIVPKLKGVMHELQINPANQNVEQFYWVRTWLTVIPTCDMLELMDIFFDKWEQVLYHWLCSKPNFEEVGKWFLGWKDILPQELEANERIRFRLYLGLNMMYKAVEGMEVAPPCRVRKQRQFETRKKAASQEQQRVSPAVDSGIQAEGSGKMSLRKVLEAYAQQNDLLLKPKPRRIQDEHQIYGFGNISIIIDPRNEKVFAQTEGRWSLVSLQQLLELHRRSETEVEMS